MIPVDEYMDSVPEKKMYKSNIQKSVEETTPILNRKGKKSTNYDDSKTEYDSKDKSLNLKEESCSIKNSKKSCKQYKDKLKLLSKFELMKSNSGIITTPNERPHINSLSNKKILHNKFKIDNTTPRVSGKSPFTNDSISKAKKFGFTGIRKPTQIPELKEKKQSKVNQSKSIRVENFEKRKTSLAKKVETDKLNFPEF